MPEAADTFWPLLVESLDLVEARLPASHARLCVLLGEIRLALCVDGASGVLTFVDGRHHTDFAATAVAGPVLVHVRTTREVILALADGQVTLPSAVRSGGLHVVGELGALATLDRALVVYLAAVSRLLRSQVLLERLRRH